VCRDKRDLCVSFHGTFTTVGRRVLSLDAFIHVRRVLLVAATTKYGGVVCVCCSTVFMKKNLHQVVCVKFAF